MSWSDRRTALLGIFGAVAVLAGCGFTPVYAPGGTGDALDHAVRLVTPETDDGFTLRQQLQERFGAPITPRYALTVTISTSESRVAVTREQDTNRYNVLGNAVYELVSTTDGRPVAQGSVNNFTSYAATGTTVATLAAERDAYDRLMVILADAIVDRLYLTLPTDAQTVSQTADTPTPGRPE